MSDWPAVTRSPRSASRRLTRPSASDEIVTSSTAASVPTTSTVRCTDSCLMVSTLIERAASSRLRACAVSFEQPAADIAPSAARAIAASVAAYEYLCVTKGPRKIANGNRKIIRRPPQPDDGVTDCLETGSQARAAQPEGVGDDRQRAERHGRAG